MNDYPLRAAQHSSDYLRIVAANPLEEEVDRNAARDELASRVIAATKGLKKARKAFQASREQQHRNIINYYTDQLNQALGCHSPERRNP